MEDELMVVPTPDCGSGRIGRPKEWYNVNIRKAENGFIVEVGCKTFIRLSWNDVCRDLAEYWDNPNEAQKKYCK